MNVVLSIIHCQCTQFSYGVKVKKELTRRNPKMTSISEGVFGSNKPPNQ